MHPGIHASNSLSFLLGIWEHDDDSSSDESFDLRKLPRRPKTQFDHERVRNNLYNDWFGPNPRFDDDRFKLIYRISKPRHLKSRQDVTAGGKG